MIRHTSYFTVVRVRFEFRKPRKATEVTNDDKGTVQAVIRVEGQGDSGPITTGIKCSRKEWDAQLKPKPSVEAQLLIKSMVKWEESIYSAAKTLFDEGEPITAQNLVDEKNTKAANLITLEEAYRLYLEYKKSCVGSENHANRHIDQISPVTFSGYHKRWAYVRRYLKERGLSKLYAHKADSQFLQSYYNWLQSIGLAAPTVTKYAKILGEVLNYGVKHGLIKSLVVPSFRGSNEAVTPPYNVTEKEIERIESLVLNDSKMERIRDGWLLARELCLHFSDYTSLKPEHFTLNKDNRIVFEKARQKQESGRNIRQISFVSPRAAYLWAKYGFAPPIIVCNPEFNLCLKEIGYLAELSQPLVFSHARDSGIFRWVAAGVPDVQTRLAAGWRSTRQMVRYVNFDRRLLDEFSAPLSTHLHVSPSIPFAQIHKTA